MPVRLYRIVHLVSGLLAGGLWLLFVRFLHRYFSAGTLDDALLALLVLAGWVVGKKAGSWVKKPWMVTLSLVLCGGVLVIQEMVLLYPEVLSLFIYLSLLQLGMTGAAYTPKDNAYWRSFLVFCGLVVAGAAMVYLLGTWSVVGCLAVAVFFSFVEKNTGLAVLQMLMVSAVTVVSFAFFPPSKEYASQRKFHDKVVYSAETPFQRIDVTAWKKHRWFYVNGINQFSSLDEWMYYEPMVHPVMQLAKDSRRVLILGGENGLIARELRKYPQLSQIDILPLDTAFFTLAKTHPEFVDINSGALSDSNIQLVSGDPFRHLFASKATYDAIFVDLPDPTDLEINQYYTREFYTLCHDALSQNGYIVTQAGSPYYATKAFYAIGRTLAAAGFGVLPLHNQVLTLGEWGWSIGSKQESSEMLKDKARKLAFEEIGTRWLNQEAMQMMMSFGKPYVIADTIEINSLKKPVIHRYYSEGTWSF